MRGPLRPPDEGCGAAGPAMGVGPACRSGLARRSSPIELPVRCWRIELAGRGHRMDLAGWGRGIVLAAAAGALLAAGGCRHADDRAAIQERLRAKGTAEVMREAAAARYTPPADGRLSDAQVRMYLQVRERESRIREAAAHAASGNAAAPGDASGMLAAADLRAAQELHVNSKEYAWVRARVADAQAAATNLALYQKMTAGREQLLAHMQRDLDAETDPARREAATREIADWKRGLAGGEPAISPAERANVALLVRYREPLARLRVLEERALAAAAGLELPAAPAQPAPGPPARPE
jgi:hypothetical protein